MKQRYHQDQIIQSLPGSTYFVFGSNLSGKNGAGAALTAQKYFGATPGQGWGISGKSFAFPTKDRNIQTLSLKQIEFYANAFIGLALKSMVLDVDCDFYMTRVGCGLAGYTDKDIAPLFITLPNVIYPESWGPYLLKNLYF